ncbi:phosphoribosylanthranilate isomerase [Candidatus Bathyarchaeota archaeon]|nr:phosphoribosylanthranilate isomerase [Candidatus Bathyarchaeota archaeon]
MRTVKVKICGITRKEDLEAASTAGTDAVGFVVNTPFSPRNISLEKAEKLIAQVPPFVKNVAVVVPTSINELVKIKEVLAPDVFQIHGDNLSDYASIRAKIPRTLLIRAINADPNRATALALQASKEYDTVLVDSFVKGKLGGTGIVHDWELSKRVKQAIHPKRLILAGGLNPENVAEAISKVKPYAVDVSSGVEISPGKKDKNKVREFIENAKDVRI